MASIAAGWHILLLWYIHLFHKESILFVIHFCFLLTGSIHHNDISLLCVSTRNIMIITIIMKSTLIFKLVAMPWSLYWVVFIIMAYINYVIYMKPLCSWLTPRSCVFETGPRNSKCVEELEGVLNEFILSLFIGTRKANKAPRICIYLFLLLLFCFHIFIFMIYLFTCLF